MGLIVVSIPLAFELFFVGTLTALRLQLETEVKREISSKNIIEHADRLLIAVLSAATASSSFGASRNSTRKSFEQSSAEYYSACSEAESQLRTLFKLVRNRPPQQQILKKVLRTFEHYQKVARVAKSAFDDKAEEKRQVMLVIWSCVNKLNEDLNTITQDMDEFLASERRIQKESPIVQETNRRYIFFAITIGIVFNICLAIGMAIFFSRSLVQRLDAVIVKTRQLAKGQELDLPLQGNDEIVLLDHAFHDAARRLGELDRLKKEFVSMVSHDLRTPLTSIGGLLEFLEAGMLGELTEKGKRQVGMAQNDTERLIGLINDLLDIDKLESGLLDMQFGPTDMRTVVNRSIAAVTSLTNARKMTIKVEIAEEELFADADRLVQVVVNLLSNAIKFSPSPSSIEIDCISNDECVTLRITDHGRGIPSSHKEAIFDRFSQVEIADSKKLGGSGLGLAICKQIIEQHNGKIGVESEEGKGSTFWFELPRVQAINSEECQAEARLR